MPIPSDISQWDERAMTAFIAQNSAAYRVFVSRFVADKTLIDDFLQEAYAKLWAKRADIGEVTSPRNYFYTVLRNVVLDRISFYRRGSSDLDANNYRDLSSDETFFDTLTEIESSRLIAEAVATLPPQTRDIIRRTLRGQHLAEIAGEMAISVNTVKTLKYRAIHRLAEKLCREDFAVFLLFV